MNCRNCGNTNKEEAKFCSECGLNLYLENEVEEREKALVQNKKTKKKSKQVKHKKGRKRNKDNGNNKKSHGFLKFLLILIIILTISGTGCYFYLANITSPEKVATKYFEAKKSGNPSEIYPYYEVEESEFANKKIFTKIMNRDSQKEKNKWVDSYEITNVYKNKDGKTVSVEIQYTKKENNTKVVETILLNKTAEKQYYIFDEWEVSKQMLNTVNDYKIEVIKGSTVELEGVQVSNKYIDSSISKVGIDVYKIPTLFALTYQATIKLPFGFSTEKEIDASSYTKKSIISIASNEIPDKTKEELKVVGKESLTTLYEAALSETPFAAIQKEFDTTKSNIKNLQNYYEIFMVKLKEEEKPLQKIELEDVQISTVKLTNTGIFDVSILVDYTYTVSIPKEKNNNNTGKGQDHIDLTFIYQDGKYKLSSISNLKTSFEK